MLFKTADLYDAHSAQLQIAAPIFTDFGGRRTFHGEIATVKVFEDNALVRAALSEAGAGRVLVVDGGGSRRCALVGDQLAALALANGWTGIVVYGCVRDTDVLGELDLGTRALAAHPAKSVKRGAGQRNVPLHFAGVVFRPGNMLYADGDGIVLAAKPLI